MMRNAQQRKFCNARGQTRFKNDLKCTSTQNVHCRLCVDMHCRLCVHVQPVPPAVTLSKDRSHARFQSWWRCLSHTLKECVGSSTLTANFVCTEKRKTLLSRFREKVSFHGNVAQEPYEVWLRAFENVTGSGTGCTRTLAMHEARLDSKRK